MTLLLDDRTVRESFGWAQAIEALRAAYAGDVGDSRYPERSMARGDASWLRTLTGVSAGGVMGAKHIAASMTARQVSYLIPLFDEHTAELVALMDGQSITGFRTAATSALAAQLLASPGDLDVAVIGSGFEAGKHLSALASASTPSSVSVWSPREESRLRFVADFQDTGVRVTAADDAESAVAGANLVICAARSRDESPTVRGAWLRPGTTVVSVGSTLPEQHEVDVELMDRADLIVADMVDEVLHDTGDALAATAAGIDLGKKTISLADLAANRHPGRTDDDQILLYKSVGSAVQDIAVAAMCLAEARRLGLGVPLPISIPPVRK
ncbi:MULTISPECIES: ornithine cyclodeaminase family protein [unclassified Rhodococcus (in: high G+C Gram-positive bacteria)]|uniref:ornithine cyclodeaminase family protein n=1 Tax=unclassified Rhodococcus (in: high G+C Gram-positive bacteria) TaxID=192944 RepID=UPI0006FAA49A|nr:MULTISPECIES: ornithine cyclodeaminase family protein [unclassified Rhodococcus (in: high G+C Gram-positive bacteria)]KQU29414.1 ornithine cyclodeaminase [Rhodococcus sp. Leaf225]KQU41124.1 ornithine cyclodeaminase [Rhodococcus sp. Leaf258]